MQSIESFTALADVLDRPRRVRFDALVGLTIEGLTPNEAKLAVIALEALDKTTLVAIAQGQPVGPLDAPAPTQASGAPNHARWAPAATETPPGAPETPPGAPPATDAPPDAPSASGGAGEPSESAPEARENTRAECASDPLPERREPEPVAGEIDASGAESGRVNGGEGNAPKAEESTPEEPAPKPKAKRKRKAKASKPDTRPDEVKAPRKTGGKAKQLEAGDKHEGVDIVAVKPHSDGGRLLVRADGVRVKVNEQGDEVVRSDAAPLPDVSDVPTAADLQSADASGKAEQTYPVPDEILKTRMTRDVVQHLVEYGVTDRDRIIAECLKLKEQGALAFAASKDEEAVRRRVTSTLTVMGRS